MSDRSETQSISLPKRLAYGAGDLGPSMAGNLIVVFCFFFLTNVAGLSADKAGLILLLSNLWNAIATVIVGILSDKTTSPWGRRRIWMFCSAPVLGVSFLLHWWIPPSNDWRLFVYYLAIALIFQTAAAAFSIPYGALVTDLTDESDEHTRLTSCRFSFSLGGCISSLLLAKGLSYWTNQPQEQFFELGAICGAIILISIYSCCWGTQERPTPTLQSENLTWTQLKPLLTNIPLLLLIGIYSLSWLALQLVPAVLPYFVVNCLQLDTAAIIPMIMTLQGTALIALYLWESLTRQVGKKVVYGVGVTLWIIAEIGFYQLQPGQEYLMYSLAILSGLGMATVYLIPPSMLPEVVDWDELRTGQRREGFFYSLMIFLQKIILALGLFGMGQLLTLSGFQESLPGQLPPIQPESALTTIRLITVAFPVVALISSLALTAFYPINKTIHQDTVIQLRQKRAVATQ